MIRLGMRLALTGGRAALARLALVGGAVAVGVALLLSVLAGLNAVQAQNLRYAWLNSAATSAATGPEASDPAGWALREDYFAGRRMARIDIAATGPDAPVPPGMTRLPAPGEYYVSPALSRLLAATPAGELGDRFPGHQAGVIGDAGLASPDSLIAVVGRTPQEVAGIRGATTITRMVSVSPRDCSACYVGTGREGITLILSVVAAAMLFPLLMFIGTATRLAAARREQRFAAMRLVGATPRQVSAIATVESTVAAVVGTLLGFALFPLLRLGLERITFTGERFFLGDLSLTWANVLLIGIGVPLGAAVAARAALRRVRITPLGVARRVTPRPPRAWRLIPVLAGLGELAWFVGRRPQTTNGQTWAYLGGIFLTMIGLVIAGPYLTMVGSRVLARLARRPATLIAGRRLADDPRAGFRAVSGLMLALFVTSVATGVITSIVAYRGETPAGTAAYDNLSIGWYPENGEKLPGPDTAIPAGLATTPGVRDVLVVRYQGQLGNLPTGAIGCAELAEHPELGQCAPGELVGSVYADLSRPDFGPAYYEPSPLTPAELAGKPLQSIVVLTDGSRAAIERSRTVLEAAFPTGYLPATENEWRSDFARTLVQWQRLADVVIVASLVIAGCSLAVSLAGGINERKRPFALLRLTGARLAELRRVITLESAVPLLAVSVVAIAAGFTAAAFFLRSQLQYDLKAPGATYYVMVALGLGFSLALIASTMPLLKRVTAPATARND
ncbi:ABC transporter permease [Actinoplanes sp. KI2]|uniref:FtsX-like permease family protein n=1 Tax=Actinoplanes sp. KI2 TaxID=2983315 RepID=UPI0021D59CAA|nr:FtsX-like permease family protein [Actinoplanes sp. KI2]MCU7722442.1 ABC transporter permease [Actinoplanes sp. KI2]